MKKIKWFLQRLFRGYSDADLWNLYDFIISRIKKPINAYVKYQKENSNSVPNSLNSKKEWHKILDKINYSFQNDYDMIIDKETSKQYMKRVKKIEEGFKLFGKHFLNLWD